MGNRVIILGKNYSTILGVIRSLGVLKYYISVIFISPNKMNREIVKSSRYIKEFFWFASKNDEEIINKLLSLHEENTDLKTLLFPTDDYTAYLVELNRIKLDSFFLIPGFINNQKTIIGMMNKYEQFKIASKAEIKCAKSWILNKNGNRWDIPETVTYPCFIKPLRSYEAGKAGMKKCVSLDELERILNRLPKTDNKSFSFLAQEYISIDEEFSISGICMGKIVYLPYLQKKFYVSKAHPGTTVYGSLEKPSTVGEFINQIIKMLSDLDYTGIVDIEIFRSGNQFYFNEINFRSSAVCYAAVAAGANLPGMIADYIFNGTIPKTTDLDGYNKDFICEKAAWEDYRDGYLTLSDVLELEKNAKYKILKNNSDRVPGIYFNLKTYMYRIMRLLKH